MKGSDLRQEKARKCNSLRREDRTNNPNTNARAVGLNCTPLASTLGQFFFPIPRLQVSLKPVVLQPGFHLRLLPRHSPARPDSAVCQGLPSSHQLCHCRPSPVLNGSRVIQQLFAGIQSRRLLPHFTPPRALRLQEKCVRIFWVKAPTWQCSPAGPELPGALTHLPKCLSRISAGTECGMRLFACRGRFVGRAAVIKRI